MIDKTNARLIESQLAQTQKLAALGLLISSIAHETYNLNNSITFNTPILREYLKEVVPIIDNYAKNHEDFELLGKVYPEFRKEIFEILDNIEHASSRINATVSGLRKFVSRNSAENQRWVNLKQVIEDVVVICRGRLMEEVRSFEVSIAEDLPLIAIDPVSLEQVLVNLLLNAVQATDKKNSCIRVNARQDRSFETCLIVEIIDNGCGMEKKIREKIFEPFFTTKGSESGAGLGLFVSKILVEGLGGSIEVESRPGKGSTFRVILRCGARANQ
jgi:C4-dicarboxylate-specific signal transduction histidine kinase